LGGFPPYGAWAATLRIYSDLTRDFAEAPLASDRGTLCFRADIQLRINHF
jgi:hypothetical protein